MTLLIQYTLIFASVLMLVALGGCFAERSGVINIGLEGIMVIGALGGALVLKFMPVSVGAPVMVITTVIVSALFGLVFSLLLAVAAINFKADQTITGTAMNMLATAAATVAVKAMNTAASGGNDVSSDISYTRTKDLLLVHVGGFELNWFMLVAVLCLLTGGIGELVPAQLVATALVCVGVIGLGVVEAHEDEDLRRRRQEAANRRYAKSALALLLPIAYCVLDAAGESLLRGIKEKPYLIKPNLPEIEGIVSRELKTLRALRDAALLLIEYGRVLRLRRQRRQLRL